MSNDSTKSSLSMMHAAAAACSA